MLLSETVELVLEARAMGKGMGDLLLGYRGARSDF